MLDRVSVATTRFIVWSCFSLGVLLCILIFTPLVDSKENMKALFLGVGCSLIASSVVLILSDRYTIRYNNVKVLTERWGICGIYNTRQEMNAESNECLARMEEGLDIIAWGLSNFRSVHDDRIREKVANGVHVRILCPSPDSDDVKRRAKEEGSQELQIKTNITHLVEWANDIMRNATNKGSIVVKFYTALPHEHYMRIDDSVYIGPNHYKILSQQTISYAFKYGEMYKFYTNYFNKLWNDSDFSHLPTGFGASKLVDES